MAIADYGAQAWAGIMFGIGTPPPFFYVGLCTDEPGDGWDGSVVATLEPVDSAYARQPIAKGTGWTLSDEGFVINAVELDWNLPTASWGIITNYVLMDAATLGNLWAYGEFVDGITVPIGYDLNLGVGSLTFGVASQRALITVS